MNIINLGLQDYSQIWEEMKKFTANRQAYSEDELWIVEHPRVFTQGISGKAKHLLKNSDIPVVHSDRGGQITYHAPGQLIVYCLLDLKRLGFGVKKMVSLMEMAIMDLLKSYNIQSQLKDDAPGVYVQGAKIAALGLKVKNGRTYHGLSLNVDMDLSPFFQINPCGCQNLAVTQLSDLTDNIKLKTVSKELTKKLIDNFTTNTL